MSKDAQLNWDHSIQGFTMQGHGDSTIRLHNTGHDDVISPDCWVEISLQNMNALRLHKRPPQQPPLGAHSQARRSLRLLQARCSLSRLENLLRLSGQPQPNDFHPRGH